MDKLAAKSDTPADAVPSSSAPATEPTLEHAQGAIAAAEDPAADDSDRADSVFSAEGQSSTASVSSSILEYRQAHGRTYHSDKFKSHYIFPNDEQQLDSVELTHHYLAILLDDKLHLAPLEENKRVLDVGTGTGLWAIEFADRFPNAVITGTDLSPCQPQWVPPNVRFEVDDATLDWTWDSDYFDFIHMRYLLGAVQDWNAILKEAFRCTTPGGWVQCCECDVDFRSDDGTLELEPILKTYGNLFKRGGVILKRSFFLHEIQKKAFQEAGFVDIKTYRYKIPIGGWPKDSKLAEVGRYVKSTLENDIEGYTAMMWKDVLQQPADEYEVWLAGLRKGVRNPKVHSYMMVDYVVGRKPESVS